MTWRDWLVVQVASWWYDLPSEVVSLLQCFVIFAAQSGLAPSLNTWAILPHWYSVRTFQLPILAMLLALKICLFEVKTSFCLWFTPVMDPPSMSSGGRFLFPCLVCTPEWLPIAVSVVCNVLRGELLAPRLIFLLFQPDLGQALAGPPSQIISDSATVEIFTIGQPCTKIFRKVWCATFLRHGVVQIYCKLQEKSQSVSYWQQEAKLSLG